MKIMTQDKTRVLNFKMTYISYVSKNRICEGDFGIAEYALYDTVQGVRRGFHAHKNLEQVLICVHGSCKVLLDNGSETSDVVLDKPYEGLYIANNIWREMYDFSPDAVLLVLASQLYDESDYIRDYDEFLAFISSRGE